MEIFELRSLFFQKTANYASFLCSDKFDPKSYSVILHQITSQIIGSSIIESYFSETGVSISSRSISGSIARPLAGAIEYLWGTLGIKSHPPLPRFDLAFVNISRRYKIDRIKNDLGYLPVVSRSIGFHQLNKHI